MKIAEVFQQYLEHLFLGKRFEAREVIFSAQDRGVPASTLLKSIVWPAMEQIEKLYRQNQIPRLTEHMATRINRLVADQLHSLLARKPKSGQRMVVVCGDGEGNELGAQMTADLFEADGWGVWFLGAGVPNDEVLQFVSEMRADVLCIYGAEPGGVPGIRRLVDRIREHGCHDQLQVLVTGGVFNRAEGLADEVRADLFAPDISEALEIVSENPVRVPKPDVPQPGRRRKRRRAPAPVGSPRKGRVTIGT